MEKFNKELINKIMNSEQQNNNYNTTSNSKKPIYKKWWFWVIVIIIISAIGKMGENQNQQTASQTHNQKRYNSSANIEKQREVGVGQILNTRYFDIVVNNVSLSDRISTGNQFADKEAEQGNCLCY